MAYIERIRQYWDARAAGYSEKNVHELETSEGTDIVEMERIAEKLPLSPVIRPAWDKKVLKKLEVEQLTVETNIWDEVWSQAEKINYTTTPMFLIWARK